MIRKIRLALCRLAYESKLRIDHANGIVRQTATFTRAACHRALDVIDRGF
jgi:hypothetical protein